ncbi:MAG: SMI1/KNR4 family protein [Fimbriimonas sp.]|nr:SMI1/KNR4 family protein [Fimbriimonas sp.]
MFEVDPHGALGLARVEDLDVFEERHCLRFSDEHRQFLSHIANGGYVRTPMIIPTVDCFGGAGLLDGIYGVNHPNGNNDLGRAVQDSGSLVPGLVPFGFDQGNGQLFIDMVNSPGRVVYVPWEELDASPLITYHVAVSIRAFIGEAEELTKTLEFENS